MSNNELLSNERIGYECPVCLKLFDSRRAMRSHHYMAHGTSLAEVERKQGSHKCPSCDSGFDTERAMKIHHATAHDQSLAKENSECDLCGCEFEYYPSDKLGLYCQSCVDEGATDVNLAGAMNISGPEHPAWKGGCSPDYGPNWRSQREQRIQYDNEKCVRCGITRTEHYDIWGRDLSVHHIIRKESFRRDDGSLDFERANEISNLLTLCKKHHYDYEGVPIDTRHIISADD